MRVEILSLDGGPRYGRLLPRVRDLGDAAGAERQRRIYRTAERGEWPLPSEAWIRAAAREAGGG